MLIQKSRITIRTGGATVTQEVNKPLINKNMTVLDIVSRYRETEAVFKAYDAAAGDCICCQALFDNLGDVSTRYHLNMDQLLSDLEAAITSQADSMMRDEITSATDV
jgi:hypothetical protein